MSTLPVECLWRIDELATYLDVPKDTIYEWRKSGLGPRAIKVGKSLRWRPKTVELWLDEREEEAA
ncbi:helix-turn-helix transcriptional regulator [Nocardia halotolerans]|uniref:Helix-turn-helix transcriptional regulator n=1 Tax=Nocardia halotolerans TaxID=1755878 RepID=A0ABV8VBT5_9NOCA